MTRRAWCLGHVLAGMLALGCHRDRPPTGAPGAELPANLSEASYPGALATTLSGPDFLARQRLDGRIRERTIHGEAVVQKQGEALTLIGLTPFGTKAFVAQQTAGAVESKVMAPEGKLPFPPRFMLLDVNRVLFLGLSGGPLADGTHSGAVGEERVTEVWKDGALLERRFSRVDGKPAGEIVIVYEGGMREGKLPSRVRLQNGWFGYTIAIDTVQWQAL